jgi:hypothetical protein
MDPLQQKIGRIHDTLSTLNDKIGTGSKEDILYTRLSAQIRIVPKIGIYNIFHLSVSPLGNHDSEYPVAISYGAKRHQVCNTKYELIQMIYTIIGYKGG